MSALLFIGVSDACVVACQFCLLDTCIWVLGIYDLCRILMVSWHLLLMYIHFRVNGVFISVWMCCVFTVYLISWIMYHCCWVRYWDFQRLEIEVSMVGFLDDRRPSQCQHFIRHNWILILRKMSYCHVMNKNIQAALSVLFSAMKLLAKPLWGAIFVDTEMISLEVNSSAVSALRWLIVSRS